MRQQNSITSASGKKLILALGGGGTRGAAHIGVLRELEKNHIHVDGIVGTSVGAIVGGFYCAGLSPDEIERVMLSKAFFRSYLTVPIIFRLVVAPVLYIPHLFGHHPYDGLYHGNRFAKYINSRVASLPANSANPALDIERFPVKFEAVSCDLLTARAIAIKKGNLGRALQASSAIPYLRRPVLMTQGDFRYLPGKPADDCKKSYLLVDGGPVANLPVRQARALAETMGSGVVLAVDTYGSFADRKPGDFRKIGTVGERSLGIMLGSVERNATTQADIMLSPELSDINLLSKKTADGMSAMRAGEKACQAALADIQAKIQ
ncbi:MAG: patatin-like phospholipase family protein [Cyanobacteria bacterium REEB67]|nr:patatin-like phospholipase family protein [Cyanobacteria bacterium REEB67]